jgi:hypothetical protein
MSSLEEVYPSYVLILLLFIFAFSSFNTLLSFPATNNIFYIFAFYFLFAQSYSITTVLFSLLGFISFLFAISAFVMKSGRMLCVSFSIFCVVMSQMISTMFQSEFTNRYIIVQQFIYYIYRFIFFLCRFAVIATAYYISWRYLNTVNRGEAGYLYTQAIRPKMTPWRMWLFVSIEFMLRTLWRPISLIIDYFFGGPWFYLLESVLMVVFLESLCLPSFMQ